MNENLIQFKNKFIEFWNNRTTGQKRLLVGSVLLLILIVTVASIFATKSNLVPLYSNLSISETSQIKSTLDSRGIQYEIANGGTTILVPDQVADSLKVDLAGEGIPNSGNIDYSFFSQNAGFGMTDNEFNVVKLDSMQTELANLIKGIDGVSDAKVMINLPEQSVFLRDEEQTASASIVLNTSPGYQFDQNQINALYHLVSKSVPNLSTNNIVMMNQFFEYFDPKNENNFSAGSSFATQQEIKQEIERDIQLQVQQMLGTMMGRDKVVVSVTADVDFTQENRQESIVQPVDPSNMEGIAISAQRISETFTGNGEQVGGVPGSGDTDIPNYVEGSAGTNGDYERIEETINNEVNRIQKEIVESPYKIRDLGIQVMVEPPVPDDPTTLPTERVDDITKILSAIVRTSINKDTVDQELTNELLQDKIVVSVQPFNGKIEFPQTTQPVIPTWAYVAGGIALLVIIFLIFLLVKKNRKQEDEVSNELVRDSAISSVPDVNDELETEGSVRRKQLEKMAKEKPEDFAKLLRTWIAED